MVVTDLSQRARRSAVAPIAIADNRVGRAALNGQPREEVAT